MTWQNALVPGLERAARNPGWGFAGWIGRPGVRFAPPRPWRFALDVLSVLDDLATRALSGWGLRRSPGAPRRLIDVLSRIDDVAKCAGVRMERAKRAIR